MFTPSNPIGAAIDPVVEAKSRAVAALAGRDPETVVDGALLKVWESLPVTDRRLLDAEACRYYADFLPSYNVPGYPRIRKILLMVTA